METTWTAMVIFYSLLFSVALLLFTCLCVLCKRKNRKTRDVNQILGATERTGFRGFCRDVEENSCDADPDPEPVATVQISGHCNTACSTESELSSLPPDYEEALKTKYRKIYPDISPLYENLPAYRSLPTSEASTPSTSESFPLTCRSSHDPVLRNEEVERPPPPYEIAVRQIDASGHF